MTTHAAVTFTGVTKTYGTVRAVDDLGLELRAGETVALLGPNGAGKSTTLDLLLGLRPADTGEVRVFGTSPREAITAGRVGAMLQSGGLMDEVTVRELVRLGCALHPRPHAVDDVLTRAGLTQIADRKVNKLSGGQEQRVRFALATAGDSDLIVLDEPTTGMDVSARHAFWSTMRAQADQGRTVLFATHYLEEADAIADRVLVLHRGRLLADGTAAEIKAKAGARRVSFDLEGPIDEAAVKGLPFLTGVSISGQTVRIQSTDADATVHALYGLGGYPSVLFLLIAGKSDTTAMVDDTGLNLPAYVMVSMASFGALTAVLMGNSERIAKERESAWVRQLRLTTLPGRGYVLAKTASAAVVSLPSIVIVFAVAAAFKDVRFDAWQWLALTGATWAGSLVVVLTTFGRPGYLRSAMEAGAAAFLVKDAPAAQLADAVRKVLAGERVIDPTLAAAALAEGANPLTDREREVLRAAADGRTNAELAAALHLSPLFSSPCGD